MRLPLPGDEQNRLTFSHLSRATAVVVDHTREGVMEELIQWCAGIDVSKTELMVCARVVDAATGELTEIIQSWPTMTPDLLNLVVWLRGLGVTHVAMESTGVYWKAPYYLMEDQFSVLLVNAAHVKHVPGRKTPSMPRGWRMGCCGARLCPHRRSESCGI